MILKREADHLKFFHGPLQTMNFGRVPLYLIVIEFKECECHDRHAIFRKKVIKKKKNSKKRRRGSKVLGTIVIL
jgi:hypothetical protein